MTTPEEIPKKMKQMVVMKGGATVKDCKLEIREVDVPVPRAPEAAKSS